MSEQVEFTRGDTRVTIERVKPLPDGGVRLNVETDDGRRWRLDVSRSGDIEVVSSWRDGDLTDVPVPDWMDDVVARLQRH